MTDYYWWIPGWNGLHNMVEMQYFKLTAFREVYVRDRDVLTIEEIGTIRFLFEELSSGRLDIDMRPVHLKRIMLELDTL